LTVLTSVVAARTRSPLLVVFTLTVLCGITVVCSATTFFDNGIVGDPRYFVGVRGIWMAAFVAAIYNVARARRSARALMLVLALVAIADRSLQRQWRRTIGTGTERRHGRRSRVARECGPLHDESRRGVPRHASCLGIAAGTACLRDRRPEPLIRRAAS
jgi:hypothetical protein